MQLQPRYGSDPLIELAASTRSLIELLGSLADDEWALPAEAPPGHLSIDLVARHALWGSWVHERDVLLPLGEEPPVVDEEVAASLSYVAALAPAFALSRGSERRGRLVIDASEPAVAATIDVTDRVHIEADRADVDEADLVLDGPSIDLLEALSIRAPLRAEVPSSRAWLVEGLAITFDAESTRPDP